MLVLLGLLLGSGIARSQDLPPTIPANLGMDALRGLACQHDGRWRPLDTVARDVVLEVTGETFFRDRDPSNLERPLQDGEWYQVRILERSSQNGQNRFVFELSGKRYRFVDDEENQGWSDNVKTFSLFLYDDEDRCLIEVPVKLKVHRAGRSYSILSDGPRAFLPGNWVNEFIKVKLKHQHLHNREIREQKHQERLWEIEDLKDRFGISD